jgi:DNA polymerase-3 subunit gamma/tau
VKFIFATTEANKIPITILSRCQRFNLGGVGRDRIKGRLRQILQNEGIEADDDSLDLIARRAGGSMRDAQSLLDQALAFANGKLTLAQLHALLGTANDEHVVALATAVLDQDVVTALALLNQALEQSVQLGELLEQLIDFWRQLLLLKSAPGATDLVELPEAVLQLLDVQLKQLTLDSVLTGLDLWVAAKARMRTTGHPRVVLEMAIIRICRLAEMIPLAAIAKQLAGLPTGTEFAQRQPSVKRITEAPRAATPAATANSTAGPTATNGEGTIAFTTSALPELWESVLGRLGPLMATGFRKAARQTFLPPATLLLGFPAHCAKERDLCMESSRTSRLEEALTKLTGKAITVRYELLPEGAVAPPPRTDARPPKSAQQRQAALQEPLVKGAVEKLGAQLLKADDGFGTPPTGERPS